MRNFLKILKDRLIGKQGFVFSILGLVIANMAVYLWWHGEIDTMSLSIAITVCTGLLGAKSKDKNESDPEDEG